MAEVVFETVEIGTVWLSRGRNSSWVFYLKVFDMTCLFDVPDEREYHPL